MPICSNPEKRRLRVPVGQAAVILVVRNYSDKEYAKFMGQRYGFSRKGKIEDHSMESRIRFIDAILMDIEAQDARGAPDRVTYFDSASGQEKTLDASILDWKRFVNPSWKIAAALELEGESAEIEESLAKN